MKAALLFIAIFALAMLIFPMMAIQLEPLVPLKKPAVIQQDAPAQSGAAASKTGAEPDASPPESDSLEEPEETDDIADTGAPTQEEAQSALSQNGVAEFLILDLSTGRISEVPVRDYVRGAVAAEMPASFHSEAMKAQAVAAHTYALYQHMLQQRSPNPNLNGADFAADPSNLKGYVTESEIKKFYGEDYADLYWNKVCAAADSVLEYVMEYEDEPVIAAYHAISAGQTEAAENVWGAGAPYLSSVGSEGDLLAAGYESEAFVAVDTARKKLSDAYPGMDLSGPPDQWLQDLQRSDSGYLLSAVIGGVSITGPELRTLFDLRSHNLEIAADDTGLFFTAYGYGHGVGLSQNGADYLARQGYTFDEILQHYYSGISLKLIDFEALA